MSILSLKDFNLYIREKQILHDISFDLNEISKNDIVDKLIQIN